MDQKSCTTIVSPDPPKLLSSRESHPGVIPDDPGLSRIKTFDRRHPNCSTALLVTMGDSAGASPAVGCRAALARIISEALNQRKLPVAAEEVECAIFCAHPW